MTFTWNSDGRLAFGNDILTKVNPIPVMKDSKEIPADNDFNPPELPASVGTNEVAGRKLVQTEKWNNQVDEVNTIEFKADGTFTWNRQESGNGESVTDTYLYTYDSTRKRIYYRQTTYDEMTLEEYEDWLEEGLEPNGELYEDLVEAWQEAHAEGYTGTVEDYRPIFIEEVMSEPKYMMECMYVFVYTLGGSGEISKLEEVCDLSVQDWKHLDFEYETEYNENDTIRVDIRFDPYFGYSCIDYQVNITEDNYNSWKTLGYEQDPSSTTESEIGAIVFNFNAKRSSDGVNPSTYGKDNAITFSYTVNKDRGSVTFSKSNETYELKPRLVNYTNGTIGN